MGWGFRKSVRLGKGVRLNFSKRGVGISAGVKGFRVGVGPSGARMRASIPGTGIYYEERLGSRKRKSTNSHLRMQKELERMDAISRAEDEVAGFENLLYTITHLHTELVEPIDWKELSITEPPFSKGTVGPNEQQAIAILNNYKPSLRDRIFNRVEVRKNSLQEEIIDAREIDTRLYEEWKENVQLAENVLNRNVQAYMDVLERVAPFQTLLSLGSEINAYITSDDNTVNIECRLNSEHTLPKEVKSLTKTGKVSIRKMGVSKYNELLLSYVTSGSLAIAKEAFATLPIDSLYVHCVDTIENKATGFSEDGVLLSILFDREQTENINFNNIEPQESIQLFDHKIDFKKTKGFSFVNKLNEV